ncbi:MAG: hypothetical protein Harvfovirus16_15 [Harvfovirus sp.]|uniref:Uncharacterized protein n=1 Tax=Harvfovirus sp. TaxID=2487768 RepID=A0A3G5A3Q3_9VIRU|nr:MAG: hypothetical protein Harvfovirus16_15 [Harvfovirus sp.]
MSKKNKQSNESGSLPTSSEKEKKCNDCANYVKPSRRKERAAVLVPSVLNIIQPPKNCERFERSTRNDFQRVDDEDDSERNQEFDNSDNPFNLFGNCGGGFPCQPSQFGQNPCQPQQACQPCQPQQGCQPCNKSPPQQPSHNNRETYYLRLSCDPLCEIRVVNPKKSVSVHVLTDRLVQNKMTDDGFINNQYDGSVVLYPGAFISFIPIYDDNDRCAYWGIYGCGFESSDRR